MANTGPDGVNRCGAFRGMKCEMDRYNDYLNSPEYKAKSAISIKEAEKAAEAKASIDVQDSAASAENMKMVIFGVLAILVIAITAYFITKK